MQRNQQRTRVLHNRLIVKLYFVFLIWRAVRILFSERAFRIASICKFESQARG